MTFPVNLHLGPVEIPSHLVCEILAYVIGFRYFLFLRKKDPDPISMENRMWIFAGAAGGALLFSRLIGIFEEPGTFLSSPNKLIMLMSSKTIVGGLLGGLAGVEITKKILKVKVSSGDLITYPIILALIIGRIGCFLAGVEDHTYGNGSSLP